VIRSGFHEGSHYGSVVVVDTDGSVLHARGPVDAPVFPRSSNKPFQAVAMLAAGALEEVAELMARDLDPALPIMKAVGVRELAAQLRGELTPAQALAAAQQETRRYAKRQSTWQRGQMAEWPRVTALDADGQWRQFLALNPGLTP